MEDVGNRMPEVNAGRIDQGDVGGNVFILVFGLSDPEFELIQCARYVESEAERDGRFQYGNVIIETHVQFVDSADGCFVAVHLDDKRKDLDLVVMYEKVDRYAVDEVPIAVF